MTDKRPDIPTDAVSCQFRSSGKDIAIFVDTAAGLIHFQNSHVPRGFLTTADKWYSCGLKDVMRVHNTSEHKIGWCLTVITRVGAARIRKQHADYTELHDTLTHLVRRNDPGFLMHDPAIQAVFGFIIFLCGCLGMFLGWWALPDNATDLKLGIYVTIGVIFGITGSMLFYTLVDRSLQGRSQRQKKRRT